MMPLPCVLHRSAPPEAVLRMRLDENHPAFEGHFPGFPLLPGVVQVDWAARLGEELFGPFGPFQGLRLLKFQGFIRPGDVVDLSLRFRPETGDLTFAYTGDEERKSSGILRFAPRG